MGDQEEPEFTPRRTEPVEGREDVVDLVLDPLMADQQGIRARLSKDAADELAQDGGPFTRGDLTARGAVVWDDEGGPHGGWPPGRAPSELPETS